MSKFLNSAARFAGLVFCAALFPSVLFSSGSFADDSFNIGRTALPEEIAAWDIDVRPDGQGLPVGSASVEYGEEVFSEKCAYCHGDFGEGIDRWPVLAGGQDTLTSDRPVKTTGSYWPYLSTLYDYIYRAMPFGEAQSLTPDEVYGTIAYLLYMNDVVTDDQFVLSNQNFTSVRLPNETQFFTDDRPDTPQISDGLPCMKNCKDRVEILSRAVILDVTPDEEVLSDLVVE